MDLQRSWAIVSCLCWSILLGSGQDLQLLSSARNATQGFQIPIKPLVVQTPLTNYETPSLRDYQECHANAERCRNVCSGVDDVSACLHQCPVCPVLIKENKAIQGVNDTQSERYVPLNTTNVIGLSNNIYNTIDTSRGNITFHNDNTVHLQQNVSTTGGQFGFGHNNSSPCCMVIRPRQRCGHQVPMAVGCHRKHRMCSPHCVSRIMLAKTVVECGSSPGDDFSDQYPEDDCQQIVQYIPYRGRRRGHSASRCNYTPFWPFVSCWERSSPPRGSICSHCLQLPYAYILQNGIPAYCQACFANGPPAMPPIYPESPYYSPDFAGPSWIEPAVRVKQSDWQAVTTKCLSPEGDVIGDCPHLKEFGEVPELHPESRVVDHAGTADYDEDYIDQGTMRRRRQTFVRSKYSRRQSKT